MTTKDLYQSVSKEAGINQKQAKETVVKTIEAIASGLKEDGEVKLEGLGKLKVIDKAARIARNPMTGEAVDVPAKKVVKFVASSDLIKYLG